MTIAPRDRRAGADDVRTLRASGPADLLTLLPYLLGYYPHESLVVALVSGARVAMCARLDLSDAARPGQVAGVLAPVATRHQAEGVILVVFGSDRAAGGAVLDVARTDFLRSEIPVIEAVFADGSRWWSRTCAADCCPADGTAYDPTAGPLAAEAVYAGLSVATDRSAIAASVAGPAEREGRRLSARVRDLSASRPELAALDEESRPARQLRVERTVLAALRDLPENGGSEPGPVGGPGRAVGPGLSDDVALGLALLVRDVEVRDAAWSLIRAENAVAHVRLWRGVVARCPPELAVGPLCLAGVAAWISGDGTLQMCCVERARQLQPTCSMAGLLDELNARAAPPSLWAEIRPGLRARIEAGSRRSTAAFRDGGPVRGRRGRRLG